MKAVALRALMISTILAWLGLSVGFDMDGVAADFLELRSIPRIATYDGIPIEREREGRADVEASIVDQLRDLGYVEE